MSDLDTPENIRILTPAAPRAIMYFAVGLGGRASEYVPLADGLAKRGIATVRIEFDDADTFPLIDWQERIVEMDDLLRARQSWLPDALRYLPEVLGGHSAGAQTAQAIAGGLYRDDSGNPVSGPGSPIIPATWAKCAVIMSPQGVDWKSNTTQETWETLVTPVLYGTGTLDEGRLSGGYPDTLEAFTYGEVDRAQYVLLKGDHSHGGLTGRGTFNTPQADAVLDLMAAWVYLHTAPSWSTKLQWWRLTTFPESVFLSVEKAAAGHAGK